MLAISPANCRRDPGDHEDERARASQALRGLDWAGASVAFADAALATGISRSWLYTQPDIGDQIQHLRDATA